MSSTLICRKTTPTGGKMKFQVSSQYLAARWNNASSLHQEKKNKKERGESVQGWSAILARGGHNRAWWQDKNKVRSMVKAYNKVNEMVGHAQYLSKNRNVSYKFALSSRYFWASVNGDTKSREFKNHGFNKCVNGPFATCNSYYEGILNI